MGAWTKNKVESSQINGGQEYTINSNPSLEQLNAITNNSFYAVDKADEALEKANSAFENNGTVVRISNSAVATLNFDSDPQTQINSKASQSDLDTANSNIGSLSENKANKDLSNVTIIVDKTKVIYDVKSNDTNVNWGYTSGLIDGTHITNLNLSKYKRLKIYYYPYNNQYYGYNSTFELDLTNLIGTDYFTNYTARNYINNIDQITIRVSVDALKEVLHVSIRYNGEPQTSNSFIYKIEGVY